MKAFFLSNKIFAPRRDFWNFFDKKYEILDAKAEKRYLVFWSYDSNPSPKMHEQSATLKITAPDYTTLLFALIPCFCELVSAIYRYHFQHFTSSFPHYHNLASISGKTFLQYSERRPFKIFLKKNVQHPNTRAIPVGWYQFRPTLVYARQYI